MNTTEKTLHESWIQEAQTHPPSPSTIVSQLTAKSRDTHESVTSSLSDFVTDSKAYSSVSVTTNTDSLSHS